MKRICLVPQVHGVGGMVSFRDGLVAGLQGLPVEISFNLNKAKCDSILVIGGTRDIPGLWQAKRRGVRIVQRLNGMNWLHRRLKTGLKHYFRAEYGNLILHIIRDKLADHIVYQSAFSRDWWQRVYGATRASDSIIHNAVDLSIFSPESPLSETKWAPPQDHYRVLLVEGSLMGGYEMGLETAVQLVETLNDAHSHDLDFPVELMVAGRVSDETKSKWSTKTEIPIQWVGLVPKDEISALDRSAHLLYASDINAACPNSVIEALGCGLPVLAFDTGALGELVVGYAGRIVPYGGDPWNLDQPDVSALAQAAVEILRCQSRFRTAARSYALNAFPLDKMIAGYLQVL